MAGNIVFFSWQSDLPAETNRNPIKNGLQKACKKLDGDFELDEATRNMSGSGRIDESILKKIEKSDIFVADISTIRRKYKNRRASQNPNVLFELGFAVAHLGWDRIILLYNNEFGKFETDIPFDFRVNRISRYALKQKPGGNEKELLNKLFHVALKTIVQINPKKPAELKGLSIENIQHQRDVEKLRWLLNEIHWPTIDDHIKNACNQIDSKVCHFAEGISAIVKSSLWQISDSTLDFQSKRFEAALDKSLSHGEYYHYSSGTISKFRNAQDGASNARDEVIKACQDLREVKSQLLERIKSSYPEIDIMETNRTAWADFLKC